MNRGLESIATALERIGVDHKKVETESFIGSHLVDGDMRWVVSISAATQLTFELPGRVSFSDIYGMVDMLTAWDVSMMTQAPIPEVILQRVRECAEQMFDCPTKRLILGK